MYVLTKVTVGYAHIAITQCFPSPVQANTVMDDSNITTGDCLTEVPVNDKWWVFLVTSIVIYVVGVSLSLLCFLTKKLLSIGWHKRYGKELHSSTLDKLQKLMRQLVSGDTIPSKILLVLTLTSNIIFMGLALYRAYRPVERCFTLSETPDIILELVVSLVLIVFFLVRLLATRNILKFWLNLYTAIDVLTLPHVFVAIHLGQDWLGLKSLRFIWLQQIISVIRFIPFIHSQDTIDIVSLLVRFIALWLTAAGIVHLLESSGDGRDFEQNAQNTTFLEYAYFIMVTMSTVGYGDLSAKTASGKAFMTFFIIGGLAFFAFALPALVDITVLYWHRTQYSKFDTSRVPRHVIVCGHIVACSVEEFLKDFLHPDRGDQYTHVLFLHPERPDQELRSVIRSSYTRVQYVVGSVLNGKDLIKAQIHTAAAAIILANKHCKSPKEEDNANLLRLVSFKNTTTEIPVIIQVLCSSSKYQVDNIPGWFPGRDIVLSLNELKLGLLAQSCMCPGLSTLIANLFYTSDFPVFKIYNENNAWQDHYTKGASNEIYPAPFSHTFNGMKFHEAARICYQRLGLILLAVEDPMAHKCYISPSPIAHAKLVIRTGMEGYFIGQDLKQVQQVSEYPTVNTVAATSVITFHRYLTKLHPHSHQAQEESYNEILPEEEEDSPLHSHKGPTVYTCEKRTLESCILQPGTELNGHIVLCIFANQSSPPLGLHDFVRPLRSNTIPQAQLKHLVIISDRGFLEREWSKMKDFPDIHLVLGSPLDWQNLLDAHVDNCFVCVIITAVASSSGHEQAIDDKEAVLCCLSIQKHFHDRVMVITDLVQESNVQFLDISDEDEEDERVYLAQPFACGEAFATSVFDSITTAAFHSPGTLHLVENLICASGAGRGSCSTRCQVVALPLNHTQHQMLAAQSTFGGLYCALLDHNCVCLAIYRKLAPESNKHYVITAPADSMPLEPDDIAFILVEVTQNANTLQL